jgi:hypothetical protein
LQDYGLSINADELINLVNQSRYDIAVRLLCFIVGAMDFEFYRKRKSIYCTENAVFVSGIISIDLFGKSFINQVEIVNSGYSVSKYSPPL